MSSTLLKKAASVAGLAGATLPMALTLGAAPAHAASDPGCVTSDGKVVRSAAMINGYGQNEGTVQVWYSPSSRCVWAAMASSYGVACDPGVDGCGWASVVRNDGRTESCSFAAGGKKCVTAAINDANKLSYATGSIDTGPVSAVGTTGSY